MHFKTFLPIALSALTVALPANLEERATTSYTDTVGIQSPIDHLTVS